MLNAVLIVARAHTVMLFKMSKGSNSPCVWSHAALMAIAGLAIPAREGRISLFASPVNHPVPRQPVLVVGAEVRS